MSTARDIAHFYGQGKEVKSGDGHLTMCPVHGNTRTPSMSIRDIGDGDVEVFCHGAGCNWKDIKDHFRKDGLLPEWKPGPTHKQPPRKSPPKENENPETPPPEKESFIWKQAGKDGIEHARKYFAGRAITMDLPVCFKWNSYTDKNTGENTSMIVAAASKPADTTVYGVQRLFIDLENYKKTGAKMHGPCEGRGVWFNRKGDMTEIIVGEGIETVMSAMQATGQNGVAALSTSGMKKLEIPDKTERLYIITDSDPIRDKEAASMPGQKAAYIMAQQFTSSREGRQAFIVSPDDTCFTDTPAKLDFNDLLKDDPTGESIRARFEKTVDLKDLAWRPPERDEGKNSSEGRDGYYPEQTVQALEKMNAKYAAVLLGGDFRIAQEGFDERAQKHTISFLKVTSFYSFFANRRVAVPVGEKGNVEYRELAKVWMGWNERRTYEGVVFDPSGRETPGMYNLFRGFPIKPEKGDWSLFRQHILDGICRGNKEHFEYVLAWMARAVQDPGGDKPGVALVLKGGKGIGKGVFANYFGSIFGEAFLPISDQEGFTGKFNMHLSKSLVVFLDEAVWGGDKRAEGRLKQLITEPTVMFEPKGIDSMSLSNYINVIIASNENWVVPATGDERRFLVLNPSEEYKQDTVYFGKIKKEQLNGGAAAMMYDLLRHDYSHVNLRKAPVTEGLAEQVQCSLPSTLEFWHTALSREYLLSNDLTGGPVKTALIGEYFVPDDLWPGMAYKYEVYTEYLNYCKTRNERYPDSDVAFWKQTWNIWNRGKGGVGKRVQVKDPGGKRVDAVRIPDLKESKASFAFVTKIRFENMDQGDDDDLCLTPFQDQF